MGPGASQPRGRLGERDGAIGTSDRDAHGHTRSGCGRAANLNNQAHSISRLIAVITDVAVPVVGVVLGAGYSGGDSSGVRERVVGGEGCLVQHHSAKGLAAIARKQRLSWYACAQQVGLSAVELCENGILDAVVDYSPEEGSNQIAQNLVDAIQEAISWSMERARKVIGEMGYAGAPILRQVFITVAITTLHRSCMNIPLSITFNHRLRA